MLKYFFSNLWLDFLVCGVQVCEALGQPLVLFLGCYPLCIFKGVFPNSQELTESAGLSGSGAQEAACLPPQCYRSRLQPALVFVVVCVLTMWVWVLESNLSPCAYKEGFYWLSLFSSPNFPF